MADEEGFFRRREVRREYRIDDLALRIFHLGRRRDRSFLPDRRVAIHIACVRIRDAIGRIVSHLVTSSWRPGQRVSAAEPGIIEYDLGVRRLVSAQHALEVGREPDDQMRINARFAGTGAEP